ncbi:uncharacterized protein Z518_07617 [Rhinocladiella mackenziei CBS 650.93]|uniref:Uncharacterized protein n=1 Tax=Rhinocladiella mackenziei CBS 650.93 TaxID=1442369 RepID=A0A0D2IE24_9EURO|nr:uncharacterized protein Z518_07617 [Rhinocladiella mackenziei CBS 650.93]KIX04064.1 hypothetical protein Z518_07617 [Rhinocladiella mackenziei CBS 650.93]
MAEDFPNANFSLTSSSGSRRDPGSKSSALSTGSYSDGDDIFPMGYSSMPTMDSPFNMPVMSNLGGFETNPAFEFLAEDVLSGGNAPDLNLVPSHFHGQGHAQDGLNPSYMLVDGSVYNPGMMSNFSPDLPWHRVFTPPPEEYVQEVLPHHFLSAQSFEEEPCQSDREIAMYGANTIPKPPSYRSDCLKSTNPLPLLIADPSSTPRRSLVQPRPIRSASERSDSSSEQSTSTVEPRNSKEDSFDKVKARSDPLYEAKADKDGLYHCPMFKEAKCTHKPTKQKCIYNKYLDSHLRPYRCKFADRPECEDARFSSNACLFRHEREAHGLHNHGVNPFLCKFPDCDRAREGNGFPRRWNQRDHMKRVHDYVEDDSPKDRSTAPDQAKRRRAPAAPTSTPMKRSGSSAHAKAQALAGAAIPSRYYGRTISQARYAAPRKTYRAQQIAAELTAFISSESTPSKRTVQIIHSHHASSDEPYDPSKHQDPENLRDQIYNSAAQEKTTRAAEFSAIKRALSKDNVVIADGLNYIKGYRYQLWCEAKAAGTRCCVVHVAAQEDECKKWNKERLTAWGQLDDSEQSDEAAGVGKHAPGKQGKDILGDLVPESHTAIYGDRAVEKPSKSRSSSVDGLDGDDDGEERGRPPRQNDDAATLKSLYVTDDRGDPLIPSPTNQSIPLAKQPASSSTHISPPAPTCSPPYSPRTLLSLFMRYEPPSPFSRWDTPLFTIPSSDPCPPARDIWAALFPGPSKPTSKKSISQLPPRGSADRLAKPHQVKPHAATVLPKATTSDALQTLESATMDVARHILVRAREQGLADGNDDGGDVSLSVPIATPDAIAQQTPYEATLHIPPGATLTQPLLQRLRRKYTQIQRGSIAHGQGYVNGRRAVVEGFITFLDREWNDDG